MPRSDDPYILVLSTGRCGSLYMAKVLQASGLDCPWEVGLGRNGGVGWQYAAEGLVIPPEAVVLHQTRGALANISSFHSFTYRFWSRARQLGGNFSGDKNRDAMLYYLQWNRRIEALTDAVFFIEQLGLSWIKHYLEVQIGCPLKWNAAPKETNRRDYKMLTWQELDSIDRVLANECRAMEARLIEKSEAYNDGRTRRKPK